MNYTSEMARIQKNAEAQGWKVKRTTAGHWSFYAPNGEDIVTTAGTPSDHRGHYNFIARMKKGGYMTTPATTLLGSLLSEAMDNINKDKEEEEEVEVKPVPKGPKISARLILRDYIRKGEPGRTYMLEELEDVLRVQRPDLGKSSASQSMTALVAEGLICRQGVGMYRLVQEGSAVAPLTSQPKPTAKHAVGAHTGDAAIDADLAVLDEIVNTFAKLEGVLQRTRAALMQAVELKRVLANFGPKE